MLEYLVVVLTCTNPDNPATCEPIGQRSAIYRDAGECVQEETQLVAEAIRKVMIERDASYQEFIEALRPLSVMCIEVVPFDGPSV